MASLIRFVAIGAVCVALEALSPLQTTATAAEPSRIYLKDAIVATTSEMLLAAPESFPAAFVDGQSNPGQDVQVFTLSPSSYLNARSALAVEDPGNVEPNQHVDAVVWIATNYLEFGDSPRSFTTPDYRTAAQVAIWALTSQSAIIGDDAVARRARALYAESVQHDREDPPVFRHVELGTVQAGRTALYAEGETVQISLKSDVDELSGEDVDVYDRDDTPYVKTRTAEHGTTSVDVPWRVPGPLTARWIGVMRPGSILRAANGERLVTTQGMKITGEAKVEHERPDPLPLGWSLVNLALNQLRGLAAIVAVLIIFIAVLAGAFLFRAADKRWKKVLPGLIFGIVASLTILSYLAYQAESKEFRPLEYPVPPKEGITTAKQASINAASASSSLNSQHVADCAFDGNPATAWVSGRGLGVNQELQLATSDPVWINELVITPGATRDPMRYGFPTRIEFYTNTGQLEEFTVREGKPGTSYVIPLRHLFHADSFAVRVVDGESNRFSFAISEVSLSLNFGADKDISVDPLASSPDC